MKPKNSFVFTFAIGAFMIASLTGCDLFLTQNDVEPTPEPVEEPRIKLVAQREIRSDSSFADDHLANIEVWMDATPRKPVIVLTAMQDLEYFEISLALPVCYVFPREHGKQPSWRGGPLSAGESVKIDTLWRQISDSCTNDYATVLWTMASKHQGSKASMSMLWQWPQGDSP